MSTQDRVYETLRAELREYDIKPDTRLNIAETAERLSASTIPIREVFARLAAEGLLDRVSGGGFKVPGLSVAQVEGDFTLVFLFLRHVTELTFRSDAAAEFELEHVKRHNRMLLDAKGDPAAITAEAESYVRELLPLANSSKLRSSVEAAMDASTIYRRIYYRKMLMFDVYYGLREAYRKAIEARDEQTARKLGHVAQREWEEKTRDLCREAWIAVYEH